MAGKKNTAQQNQKPEYKLSETEKDEIEKEAVTKSDNMTRRANKPHVGMVEAMMKIGLYDLVQIDLGLQNLLADYSYEKDHVETIVSKIINNDGNTLKYSKRLLFFAERNDPLLLVGETGTSKQLVAEAIHKAGFRSDQPFNEINCSAFPDDLFDAMLFGCEKGAHSKADKDQLGLLELTNGGVLFLDEIAKAEPHLQAKLLKVIEDKMFYRFGNYEKPIKVDIRFIAAVQPSDLSGVKFLPDLKFRFGYPCCIQLSTLNERIKEGGFRIIQYCLESVLSKLELDEDIAMDEDCFNLIANYHFAGNYRELEAVLKSAVIEVYIEGRNEIMPNDLRLATPDMNADDDNYLEKVYSTDVNKIELSNIIKYSADEAKKVQKEIITRKVHSIFRDGKNIANVLMNEEGMSRSESNNHSNSLTKIIGALRDHKKAVRSGTLKCASDLAVTLAPMKKTSATTAQPDDQAVNKTGRKKKISLAV